MPPRPRGRIEGSGVTRAVGSARLDLEVRDRVEQAALQVQGVSDTAYFYTGLAFGLTCVAVYRQRP